MGFFFTEAGDEPIRKTRQERSKETLNRLGCTACPLNHAKVNTPKMQPTLAADTWIYFLGEAPGEVEDNEGRPFIGPSGRLLRHCIPNNIIPHASFDNTVRDRPLGNRDPTLTEVECCRGHVTKSIEQAKPRVIVGLGQFALQWALNSVDNHGMRGRLFAIQIGSHECWFLPTYHPARIIHAAAEAARKYGTRRTTEVEELLNTHLGRSFYFDIKRACEAVDLDPPVIFREAEVRKQVTVGFNAELFQQAKDAPVKAIDIETTTLRPYSPGAKIISVAIAWGRAEGTVSAHSAGSIPVRSTIACEWTPVVANWVKTILLDDTIKVAHNAPFELEWFIWYYGKDIARHEVWECTQLQAHFLDERRGAGQSDDEHDRRATYLSLNFLCKMRFGAPFKDWFKVDRKHMAASDMAETLVYNGADAFFTLPLWYAQRRELRTHGLYTGYLSAVPRQVTVALMQHLGMTVNQATVKRLQRQLEDEIAVIQAEIELLPVVQQYIQDKGAFNPIGNDAIIILKDYLKRKEVVKVEGGKEKISIDKGILDKIDHPLAKLIVKYRNKNKMKSTYIDPFELGKGDLIYPDGMIHCNFNATFTVTGRFSSDEPNMQNWPHRTDTWIREQIVAPEGCMIVAADYGQLEACTAAMVSKDPYFVGVLWNDYDTHMFWAAKLAELCPARVDGDFNDPKTAKAFRSLVKNKLVFPAIYGATNASIAGYLGVEQSIINELMDEFWDTFAGLKEWQKQLLKSYRKTGYVDSLANRRRRHPLTSNEVINTPIQGLASDIVVDAMNRLSFMARETRKWYLHPRLNIHDDITCVVPKEHVVESIEVLYQTMLTPTFEEVVNVPLSVEISVGEDWFHMETVGKFWSHKDL